MRISEFYHLCKIYVQHEFYHLCKYGQSYNYREKDICKHTKKGGSVEIYVALQNMTEEITGNSHKKKAWCLPVG
jgi:hypothetical protein